MHRTGAAVLALSATLCSMTACTPAQERPPTALPAGVEVELYQLRSDVAERGAQLRVTNDSTDDLVVQHLRFTDDWFDGDAVRDRTSTIPAGRTVDLRFVLPESLCEGEADAAARASRVTLQIASVGTVEVAVSDPLGFTALMHRKECLRHDLGQVATLEWSGFTPAAAPAPAELRLTVTPSGSASADARLVEVQTTNLLQFAAEPTPYPLGIDLSDARATDVAVPLLPLRCDPHAVMEDKRGTVFNVAAEVDGDSGVVEVAAPEKMRGEILRWVADWCGFGPG